MAFTFRPAVRENEHLIIVLAGGTGSGKTFTALRLATGIAGERRFCGIDTEAGRMKHYAGQFQFDHCDFAPPFTPARYLEAIQAADAAGYPVIVVDSASHEHAGDGGLLDMHEADLQRMAGDDWKKRDSCNMAAWIKPKGEHKKMVQKLLQVRAHIILCLRAEEKVEMMRGEDGKMKIQPKVSLTGKDGWIPICEKNLPFEATCSFLLTPDAPGYPKPIKLQEQHRHLFPLDKPISEESGRGVAQWAAGAAAPSPFISVEQQQEIRAACTAAGVTVARFIEVAQIGRLEELPALDFPRGMKWIERQAARAAGPEPITDEAVALRRLDAAQDEGAGAAILDLCKSQAFYPRVVDSFNQRFNKGA